MLLLTKYLVRSLLGLNMFYNRYIGCLIGLAIGDAIGTSVEFKPRGSFEPVTDMLGGGVFTLHPGEWTDDTSMALCLAQSLIDCNGFDANDQMKKYLKWREYGYMSSNGRCFDIGNTVAAALDHFKITGNPYAGSTHERSAGNGSIMRLAPIPMFFIHDDNMLDYAAKSSRTTHGQEDCISGCVLLSHMIKLALAGYPKDDILSLPNYALSDKIKDVVLNQTYKNEIGIVGSGYVVKSLEAALWAFYKGNSFKECVLLAVNLGDDADTTGAIAGQLAGAFYGYDNIPVEWIDKIVMKDTIISIASKIHTILN